MFKIGDKVSCLGKYRGEIIGKMAMASPDFPDGWTYLVRVFETEDEGDNEFWTNSRALERLKEGETIYEQTRLF